MNLKHTLKFLFLLVFSALLTACGYPTPDRTTGITPFVVVVTPTPDSVSTPTVAVTTAVATTAAATTSSATATPTEAPPVTSYTVKEGDTLLAIANKLGVDVIELQKLNDIDDPAKLQIDTVLKVPPKKTAKPTAKP